MRALPVLHRVVIASSTTAAATLTYYHLEITTETTHSACGSTSAIVLSLQQPTVALAVLQGGSEWVEAHRDALSGLGAGEIPATSRQGGEASPMAQAQALLALTATPRTMPCRDNERAAITAFVEESLTAGEVCCPTQPPLFPSSLQPPTRPAVVYIQSFLQHGNSVIESSSWCSAFGCYSVWIC